MKKLLALMLALILALSCTLALAEAPEAEAPATPAAFTLTSRNTVDREVLAADAAALGLDESYLPILDAVAAVVNEVCERLVIADNGVELALSLKDTDLFTLSGELTEENILLGCSLIPSYVLTVSAATIEEALSSLTTGAEELSALDTAALTKAFTDHFQTFITSIMGAISYGEAESGDFVLDGISYNVMLPLNVDLEAIINALNTLQADLTADQSIQTAMQALEKMGVSIDPGEPIPTEDLPTMEMAAYMTVNENGETGDTTDVVFKVYPAGSEEPATWGDVLVQGSDVRVMTQFATGEEGASPINLFYEFKPTETGSEQRMELEALEMYIGFRFLASTQDVITLDSEFYLLDREKPLFSQNATIAMEGQRTVSLSDDSRKPIALEDLSDEENAQSISQKLMMDMMFNGLGKLITDATQAMPEEVGALMNMIMSSGSEESAEKPAA